MRLLRSIILPATLLLITTSAGAQDANVKHYEKDGLSFDYPASWQLGDKSTGQMQFLELMQGDVTIRVRSPRELLKTPEKEAHARKLFQDQYVDNFADQFQQHGDALRLTDFAESLDQLYALAGVGFRVGDELKPVLDRLRLSAAEGENFGTTA